MNVKSIILGAAICAVAFPNLALADSKTREMEANRRIMFNYAKCVVKERHDRASEAILSNVDNGTILRKYSDLIREDCLVNAVGGGAEMQFGGDLYRYALADALVSADFAKTSDTDFSNRLPLAHTAMPSQSELDKYLASVKSKRKREEAQANFDKQASIAWLSRFGECVVRQNPIKARMWLLTPTDIAEETSRISDLRSAFNDCLDNGTVKFNRVIIRGTVALNYYRLAKATVQPVAEKAK